MAVYGPLRLLLCRAVKKLNLLSLLIQQGESLVYVKQQMGHHSIRVTVDTYGHLVPGGNRAAVDRLDTPVRNLPGATSATQTQPLTAWLSWQRADLLKRQVEPKGIEPSTSRVRLQKKDSY